MYVCRREQVGHCISCTGYAICYPYKYTNYKNKVEGHSLFCAVFTSLKTLLRNTVICLHHGRLYYLCVSVDGFQFQRPLTSVCHCFKRHAR